MKKPIVVYYKEVVVAHRSCRGVESFFATDSSDRYEVSRHECNGGFLLTKQSWTLQPAEKIMLFSSVVEILPKSVSCLFDEINEPEYLNSLRWGWNSRTMSPLM